MEAEARGIFRAWLISHYFAGKPRCVEKIAQWLKDHGGFAPNPWPTHGHYILGPRDEGRDVTSPTPELAITQAKGIMDELWAARADLTVDDEIDLEEWLADHRRLVRRSAAPTAAENRVEPCAGNGHRSASRSRSPVPDHGDSYKDMYLREVNFNAALCSENALLIADNARLRSLATEDRTSANLSN